MSIKVRYSPELYHHGIKGQKWGVRRYQNEDGTLTPEGKKRYGVGKVSHVISKTNLNDPESKRYIQKIMNEVDQDTRNKVSSIISQGGKIMATVSKDELNNYLSKKSQPGFDVWYLGKKGSGRNSVHLTAMTPQTDNWESSDKHSKYLDKYYDKDTSERVRRKRKTAARLKALAAASVLLGGAAVASSVVAKRKAQKAVADLIANLEWEFKPDEFKPDEFKPDEFKFDEFKFDEFEP